MTAANSTTPVEQIDAGQANLELAQSLRDLAHWVEMHAGDIPEMQWGALHFRNSYQRSPAARDELTEFARALGDRAAEECENGTVTITGKFGPLKVRAGAPIADLRDEPPEPEPPKYEPIIPPREPSYTDAEEEAWREMEARR